MDRDRFVPAFTPVIRKPNHYQNRIQFFESWMLSKLMSGNTYILKERDARDVVVRLYVLDPTYVKPLVAPDGGVLYELSKDNLSGIDDDKCDRARVRNDPRHDDAQVSSSVRLVADGTGRAGRRTRPQIQRMSTQFFANAAKPSGALTAPADIPQAGR